MTSPASQVSLLRALPQVDRLLSSEEFRPLLEHNARPQVLRQIREALAELRREAAAGRLEARSLEVDAIRERVETELCRRARPFYCKVINATGVVLHTGLGRAPLAPGVVEALAEVASHSQRLEIDLETARRGGRDEGCAVLLRELTGCEAATVVNNNAAATLLVLASLARGRQVLLARGEMVEIGGSFRIPEIMRESGAVLVDVGTTNRTHARDYQQAMGAETGLILKVHTSNYRVQGFTSEVEIEELVEIGHREGVPVAHDLGSGCLVDLEARGIRGEPRVERSVSAGADLVCFSGDKLLGGPQAGIIVGKKRAVEDCRRHPLFRAMRPGRLVYAALESTLRIYSEGEETALAGLPVLRRLVADAGELRRRARRLHRRLKGVDGFELGVVPCTSQAGSGSLPARELESWGVRVVALGRTVDQLAAELRTGDPAILTRVVDDGVLLDLRTLDDGDFPVLRARLGELGGGGVEPSS